MKHLLFSVLVLILTASGAVSAEIKETDYLFEAMTVTARGYAVSQSDTPGSVGVATEKDISLAPKGSIVDALEKIPGITRSGDSPWGQDISIRGLSGPSVVVLLNGKRINTATDMNARLGFINPADVARIEVLKGPVSALYGSGSTGGVVNIITRKATFTDAVEAHGRVAGSGSTNPAGGSAYANISVSGADAWGLASGAFRDYSDTYGGHSDRVDHSGYEDRQGRAMFAAQPWSPLTLSLEAMQSRGDELGMPGGVSSMPALARVRFLRTDFTFASLDANLNLDSRYFKALDANFYYTKNKRRVRIDTIPAGSALPYPVELSPMADHETFGGKLQTTVEAGRHTLVAGADFWTWEADSTRVRNLRVPPALSSTGYLDLHDRPFPHAKQVSIGIFAEDDWNISDAFTLNTGARLDRLNTHNNPLYNITPQNYSRGGDELFGYKDEDDIGWHLHAGITWKMTPAWSQSVLFASSYRAADVMERFKYLNLGGGVEMYGNPDLDPEQSFYGEYALRYTKRPFKADLRLFANIVTDYIAEKQMTATRIELANVDDARIYGAELDLRWDFHDRFGAYGNVAALYGRDESNSRALPGIAPVNGLIGLDFTHPGGFWARIESELIAPQRSTPEGVDSTKGVILLNAAAGYTFHGGPLKHNIALGLDNIFDTQYYNYLAQQRGMRLWEPGISAMINYSVDF